MRAIVVVILQELVTAQTGIASPAAPDPARSDPDGNVFVAPDRFELSTSRL